MGLKLGGLITIAPKRGKSQSLRGLFIHLASCDVLSCLLRTAEAWRGSRNLHSITALVLLGTT
jgi:hypothetical protein